VLGPLFGRAVRCTYLRKRARSIRPPCIQSKNQTQNEKTEINVTDIHEDDDLFDAATNQFPSKEDMENRLVLIWPTGKNGTRRSESTGKPYRWYETVTVVIDDGPNGWQAQRSDGDPNLIASVAENGPQTLNNYQWTPGGLVARLESRVTDGKPNTYKPILGRINQRKNKNKGMANPWSIAEPTDEDKATARRYTDLIRKTSADLKARVEAGTGDDEAFD
jgi:hypothetical protein